MHGTSMSVGGGGMGSTDWGQVVGSVVSAAESYYEAEEARKAAKEAREHDLALAQLNFEAAQYAATHPTGVTTGDGLWAGNNVWLYAIGGVAIVGGLFLLLGRKK